MQQRVTGGFEKLVVDNLEVKNSLTCLLWGIRRCDLSGYNLI